MLNKYPYTDFSQINLDWFLQEFQTYKDGWDTAMAAMSTATVAANTAAGAANTAASNANTKATLANNAATNANDKATLANNAATTANTAASNANDKATLANNAATNANDKATLANNAAIAANAAAAAAASRVGAFYIPASITLGVVTCDASSSEIGTAIYNNKTVIVYTGSNPNDWTETGDYMHPFYFLDGSYDDGFTFIDKDGNKLICSTGSVWSYEAAAAVIITLSSEDDQLIPSKTYNEIAELIKGGKNVLIYHDGYYFIPSLYDAGNFAITFSSIGCNYATNDIVDFSFNEVSILDDDTAVLYSEHVPIYKTPLVVTLSENSGVYSVDLTRTAIMNALNENRNVYLNADVLDSGLIIPLAAVQIQHDFGGLYKAAVAFGFTDASPADLYAYVFIAADGTVDVVYN